MLGDGLGVLPRPPHSQALSSASPPSSSVAANTSTRLQVLTIKASRTRGKSTMRPSSWGTVSGGGARHSRTSSGAVLWLRPIKCSFTGGVLPGRPWS